MSEKFADIDKKYIDLAEIIENKLSCAAHDLDHVMRVYNLCKRLAIEEEVNYDVLLPAALLHDIARSLEDYDLTGEIDHAELGADMAERILQDLNYREELINEIKHCIKTHRFRSTLNPNTTESKILFDADKLDVLGAVGIARSYMMAGEHGEKLYVDCSLEEYLKENVRENGRLKDHSKHTSNLEFELKLKKIPDRLYTDGAKKIALSRLAYMEVFFATLREEIRGNK